MFSGFIIIMEETILLIFMQQSEHLNVLNQAKYLLVPSLEYGTNTTVYKLFHFSPLALPVNPSVIIYL